MNLKIKYVFDVMFVIFSSALSTYAIEPKKFMPECANIVAKNHEGFNAYLAHDNSRLDYCCMVSEGFHVKEDCKKGKPTTTKKAPCPHGTFAEVSHGAQQCVPWACTYNDREIMFDRDSREFKVTEGGSATSDFKCSCTPDKYLYVDTEIEVGYCMDRVMVCTPGEGVSVEATDYSDIQCAPCKDGYFQSENTKTGKCEAHTKCSGDIKVHGNATDDTECLKPGDKIVPATTTTTQQPTTTSTTPPTTTEPKTETTQPPNIKSPQHETQKTDAQDGGNNQHQKIKIATIIFPTLFVLTIIGVVVWCCKDKFCPSRGGSKSIISFSSTGSPSNRQDSFSKRGMESSSGTLATSSRASTPVTQTKEFQPTEQVANTSTVREEDNLLCNVIVEDPPSTSKQQNKYSDTNTNKFVSGGHTEEADINNKAEGVLFDNVHPEEEDVVNEQIRIVGNLRLHDNRVPALHNEHEIFVRERVEFPPDPRPMNQLVLLNNPPAPQDENTWNPNITICDQDPDQITPADLTRIWRRTEEIYPQIQLCPRCLGTVYDKLKQFAKICGISNADIHNIFSNNTSVQDQFAEIIRKTFTDNGRLYTPEKLVRLLSNREDPNLSLIDDIKEIIKTYDAENPNGLTVI